MRNVEAMIHPTLSEKDFIRLSEFIRANWGLKMPSTKKKMLESRLLKRMRQLQLESFEDYMEYLFSPKGREMELTNMVNSITTNETSFFREPSSISYLADAGIEELVEHQRHRLWKRIRIWSAGCSTGEEPYTIAMVMEDFAGDHPEIRFIYSILATDISTAVLEKGRLGVYPEERVNPVSPVQRRKYLMKSRDSHKKVVRVAPHLRSKVSFKQLNLMDDFRLSSKMEIIFCRNVIIYFDKPTQWDLLERLCQLLTPGGLIIMGHAEMLVGLPLPLKSVAPMVYQKTS